MDLFATPSVDARLIGHLFQNVPVGTSEQEFIFPYDCNFNGAAITSTVTKLGTKISLETRYQAAPGVWFRYKRFGRDWNMFPNYVCKTLLFPTRPKQGIKLVIGVENNEGVPIDIGINLYTFANLENVNPMLGQQGEDW